MNMYIHMFYMYINTNTRTHAITIFPLYVQKKAKLTMKMNIEF